MSDSAPPLEDLSRLCVHSITTKPWSLEVAAVEYARAGVRGISVWREALNGRGAGNAGALLRSHGLSVVSLCRGGFFPYADEAGRLAALADNQAALDQAAELGTNLLVLVCGALPGQTLERSRRQIRAGIEAILPYAEERGVRLGIEPLHPMYADSRSAINTLAQATDMALEIGSPLVGVVVDVYHLWWDPALEGEIQRCGRAGKLFAFHVSDWKSPTEDMLLDRGIPGEGCIDIRKMRRWVERAGFEGFIEVEIFSKTLWQADQRTFLSRIVEAYRTHV
jgi:sugar phosphate isomerase/epimerase